MADELPSMPQTFQTVVFPPDTSLSVTFVSVPSRSIRSPSLLSSYGAAFRALEVEPIADVSSEDLTRATAEYLAAVESHSEPLFLRDPLQETRRHPRFSSDTYLSTAQMILDTPLVPFEHSPLTAESLGRLAKTASGATLGAYVGFVLAGPSPLLLLTIPAGIVLMSTGVGRGLEKGLEKRIYSLVAPSRSQRRPKS